KSDILNFVQQHGPGAVAAARPAPVTTLPVSPVRTEIRPTQSAAAQPVPVTELPGDLVPMTPMRKKIAERMVESRRTSAHVHTIFKVEMTRIVKLREKIPKGWEGRHGVKLTFMPFIAKALMHGIRTKPIVNASVIGDSIQYHKNINIGIAVA